MLCYSCSRRYNGTQSTQACTLQPADDIYRRASRAVNHKCSRRLAGQKLTSHLADLVYLVLVAFRPGQACSDLYNEATMEACIPTRYKYFVSRLQKILPTSYCTLTGLSNAMSSFHAHE